jgi:protein-disulfide isomerase
VRILYFLVLVSSVGCVHQAAPKSTHHICQDLTKNSSISLGRLDADLVVARWAGGEIMYANIEKEAKGKSRQLKNDFLSAIHSHELELVNSMIAKSLIKAEAKKRSQSEEDYMSSVAVDAVEISKEQVRDFFDANQSRLNQPFEQIGDEIREYLKKEKQKELVRAEINRLYETAQVDIVLPSPNLIPVDLDLKGRPRKGPADAAITIVEFSDFECPYCRVAAHDIERRRKGREDKIAVVFMHFPLNFHDSAKPAAIASECAHRQGQFWAFHDAVFESQRSLSKRRFIEIATELKLELNDFEACLLDPVAAAQIESDMKQGSEAGVRGTPNFFINGLQSARGLPSAEDLDDLLDR